MSVRGKIGENSPRAAQPPHACVPLKPHQLAMLKAMSDVEDRLYAEIAGAEDGRGDAKRYGVLSALVGSGKTFCVLALALMDKYLPPKIVVAQRRGFWDLFSSLRAGKTVSGATLIVSPTHLFDQWRAAIAEFAGDRLSVMCFDQYSDVMRLFDLKGSGTRMVLSSNVFLVSSLYYQTVATSLINADVTFRRMVMDEADSVSNLVNYAAPAAVTWFVSATLEAAVEAAASGVGDPLRIGGETYRVDAAALAANSVDCDPEFVRLSFALPDVSERAPTECDDCGGAYGALPGLLKDDRLRRALYAGDYREVLFRETGWSAVQLTDERGVAEALLSGWRKSLDEARRAVAAAAASGSNADEDEVLKANLQTVSRLTPRVDALAASLLAAPKRPVEPESDKGRTPSKFAELVRICEEAHAAKRKTLVFGEFSAPLNDLQAELAKRGVPTVDTDGGTAQKMTEAFRRFSAASAASNASNASNALATDDGVHVLLSHSTMFSCGVNLERTEHVVLTHALSPALRTQVVGRAQRPGRSGPLTITTLLYAGEHVL